jgi:Fe-Mn family superoxide dismutase
MTKKEKSIAAFFDKNAKEEIIKTLGKKEEKIVEGFAPSIKTFNLRSEFLSEETIDSHLKLYKGYLDNFKNASAYLDTADLNSANSSHSIYRSLRLDDTYNSNAAYLHELYFANICDANSTITTDSLAFMRLNTSFGRFDVWQEDFIACAKSARSGWAITYLDFYKQAIVNCFIDLHDCHVPVGMYPLIVLDVWEHSYYNDYLTDRETYIIAMMKQLKWSVIEERFKKSDKILQILRGTNAQF